MQTQVQTIWIDTLSLVSFPKIFGLNKGYKVCRVCYLNETSAARFFKKFLKICSPRTFEFEQVNYNLGDMYLGGKCIGLKIKNTLPELFESVLRQIRKKPLYKYICSVFPKDKVDTFFEVELNTELYSLARLVLVVQSLIEKGEFKSQLHTILMVEYGYFDEIKKAWPYSGLELESFHDVDINRMRRSLSRRFIRRKEMIWVGSSKKPKKRSKPRIAVHYAEGINVERRSDIYWFPQSGIPAEDVIVYFDLNKSLKEPVPREVCKKLEEQNIEWVAIKKRTMDNPMQYKWWNIGSKKSKISGLEKLQEFKKKNQTKSDRWLWSTSLFLIEEVERWLHFFEYYNIKTVVDIAAWTGGVLEPSIALELYGGVRCGNQRSTFAVAKNLPYLRFNSYDVFFVWGKELLVHQETSPVIDRMVVAGYPYQSAFKREKNGNKNSSFKIALYDNTYGNDSMYSKRIITRFYKKFLEWVLQDEDVVVFCKEKKPQMFSGLTDIKELVEQAQNTGRFKRLNNALGRLPSDAAEDADFAIGVGVSSAVNEAVMLGCRGIHCDLIKKDHPYYDSGYGKIIFDDIDVLMEKLKDFKLNPEQHAELGEWSNYLEELNPFCDGQGGQRIGHYLKDLMYALSHEQTREQAIQFADERFKKKWGEEKIINMHNERDEYLIGAEV